MDFYRIEYWIEDDTVLRQGTPEDYTFRRIQITNCGERRHWLNVNLRKDEDELLFGKIKAMLDFAFETGKQAKALEISRALNLR